MARYIDADKLSKEVLASWDKDNHHTIEASRVHRQEHHHLMRIIEKQPTADVVPKSEVAKEFTCFVGDPHKVERCPYLDEIEKAKTEEAREIFEEIEREIKNHGITYAQRKIAELKKKYTGGGNDEV